MLNQNRGMSFAINVEKGIIDRRNRIPPRQLIARNRVDQMMIIRHQHQNLEETIIYLVQILLDYQYHQHQKPTHIAFYAGYRVASLPPKARFSTFLHNEIIIPAGSCCCPVHLQEDSFTSEAISFMKCTNNSVILNRTTIVNLLKNLRDAALCNKTSRINFDDENMLSETDYLTFT